MIAARSVKQVARALIGGLALVATAAWAAHPPEAPLPPTVVPPPDRPAPGARMEEIQETTVGTLSGVDVGVANMWERDYIDGKGAARKGLTARMDYELGADTRRIVVGEGSIIEMGGERWEVVTLQKTPGQNGSITLRCLTP